MYSFWSCHLGYVNLLQIFTVMKELEPKDTAFMFKITHSKPMEVKDFADSVASLGLLFDKYTKANGDSAEMRKAKLYVEKIEHGSIEVFLVETLSATMLPLIENINILLEFAGYVKKVLEFFCKDIGAQPQLTISECRDFSNLLTVTSKDVHGSIQMGAVNIHGGRQVFNNCVFNSVETNAAQHRLGKTEAELCAENPREDVMTHKLMTVFQLRSENGGESGNRATVEDIDTLSHGLVFDNDELRSRMLYSADNPTKYGFDVDIVVQYAKGKIAAYKVMKIHDAIRL